MLTSAGVDSEQLRWDDEEDTAARVSATNQVEPTIEEDELAEAEEAGADISSPTTPRHSARNSYQRLSRLSDDARLSMQSIKLVDSKGADSNRSSTTIKGIRINGTRGLNEADFENALRKFATERDSFLTDLSLSAGTIPSPKPRPRPKTQKIVGEETNLRPGIGSLRRKISFRELNSMKRQPSVARQGKWTAWSTPCTTQSVIIPGVLTRHLQHQFGRRNG